MKNVFVPDLHVIRYLSRDRMDKQIFYTPVPNTMNVAAPEGRPGGGSVANQYSLKELISRQP